MKKTCRGRGKCATKKKPVFIPPADSFHVIDRFFYSLSHDHGQYFGPENHPSSFETLSLVLNSHLCVDGLYLKAWHSLFVWQILWQSSAVTTLKWSEPEDSLNSLDIQPTWKQSGFGGFGWTLKPGRICYVEQFHGIDLWFRDLSQLPKLHVCTSILVSARYKG